MLNHLRKGVAGTCLFLFGLMSGALADERFDYADERGSFSIVIPDGWSVQKDVNGFQLFAEPKEKAKPTAERPVVADPNLSVVFSRNPIVIDEKSLHIYEATMKAGLEKSLGQNANLDIFLRRVIDVSDQRKGLLYYLRYKLEAYDVYNAVLVLSTDELLYRVTLRDYEVGFDGNLEVMFPYMASIDVGDGTLDRPSPLEVLTPWFGGLLACLLIFLVFNFFRRKALSGKLSGDLTQSIHEQQQSMAPFTDSSKMGSGGEKSIYDPSFQETLRVTRFDDDQHAFSEIPLSEAVGRGNLAGKRATGSVTDPESDVSEISSQYGQSAFGPSSIHAVEDEEEDSVIETLPVSASVPFPPPPPGRKPPLSPPLPPRDSAPTFSDKRGEPSLGAESESPLPPLPPPPVVSQPPTRPEQTRAEEGDADETEFGIDFTEPPERSRD